MKKLILLSTLCFSMAAHGQTAFDWTKPDCSSNNHTLFTYLDNEEVVIMEFGMGCGSCTNAATYLLQTKDKYAISNPGKVKVFYMDYWPGNDCAGDIMPVMGGYAFDGILEHCQPELTAYMTGSPMPGVVIAAGSSHQVIYQMNSFMPDDTLAIETAITDFFATVGISEQSLTEGIGVFPNPVTDHLILSFTNNKEQEVSISLFDLEGRKVDDFFKGMLPAGDIQNRFLLQKLPPGIYLLDIVSPDRRLKQKITVQ